MTVSTLNELFLINMGYAKNDTQEADVIEEYSGVLIRWLNEGYLRMVRRLLGETSLSSTDLLAADEDEPVKLDESLHPYLADYAAARGQEMRGNAREAAALYAAFERGLAEAAGEKPFAYMQWRAL